MDRAAVFSRSPSRRWFLQVLFAGALLVSPAWAGSYLTRAAILLYSAEKEAEMLRRSPTDKHLAEVTHRLAVARVAAAREMSVPKDVALAHPHLLLVLEAYERAVDGAVRGAHQTFLISLARAREETLTFRAVLKQHGWELPQVK